MESSSCEPHHVERILGIVDHLQQLRTGWKDGDPGEIKSSVSEDRFWKRRNAWFSAALSRMEFLLLLAARGILSFPASVKAQVEGGVATFTSAEFAARLKTDMDVQNMNALIDDVLVVMMGQFQREFAEVLAERERRKEFIQALIGEGAVSAAHAA